MKNKGSLTIETAVVLVACVLVLALATYLMLKVQPDEAIDESKLRNECIEWHRYQCASTLYILDPTTGSLNTSNCNTNMFDPLGSCAASRKYPNLRKMVAPDEGDSSPLEQKIGNAVSQAKAYCQC
jgi:hypothetical protein